MSNTLPSQLVSLSKFLSMVLRHDPAAIGLSLDEQGWTSIDRLLACAAAAGKPIDRAMLDQIVAQNDKKRFSISADGLRIRAAQGHSVAVDLGLAAREPPAQLFHGTATHFLKAILAQGLRPQSRQQVHLSADADTARNVGQRHGKPVVLCIDTQGMRREGHTFFQADNGVWLTDHVPAEFLGLAAGN